jgi:hypothetical protein
LFKFLNKKKDFFFLKKEISYLLLMATTHNSRISKPSVVETYDNMKIRLADGAVEELSLSFKSDGDCGVFRETLKTWHLVNTGAEVISFIGYDATVTAPVQITSGGTFIGTATTQKIGFYNTTPVIQANFIDTTSGTLPVSTTYNHEEIEDIRAALGSVVTALKDIGLVASS